MNYRNLRPALRLGMLPAAVAVALVPAIAGAQEAPASQATTLDRIEVTGSRIRQVDVETAQPVLMISRADIENQGFNSVADILQNISAAGSPTFSRASPLTANVEAGGSYIDLRNLGAQRTLVLVNGKRLGISVDGFQDVSSIPSAVVERIEVLKDGASSIYGSDAMAGVINIITRSNFDGAEVNAYYGQYGQGDGTIQNYDFVTGFSGDRGSVTIGAEQHKEDAVWAKNRWFSKDSYPGYPQHSTSPVGQWGNWRPTGTTGPWQAPNRGGTAIGADQFHDQSADDTSIASDQMHVRTPMERRSLFASANWEINDNIRFTSDLAYNQRISNRQIAGYPVQSIPSGINAPMSPDSAFNPLPGTQIDWRRRGWEQPRTTDTDLTTWRFTAAIEGSFQLADRYFDWDVGTLYNESNVTIVNNGNFFKPHVRNAVGPSFVNDQGKVVCGTPGNEIAGCVPWNPFAGFGTGAVANSLDDPNVIKYLFKEEHGTGKTETTSYFANLAGSLFTLPAGDLGFAIGYENRTESGAYAPDAIAQSGDSTNLASGNTSGRYSLDEFYAELSIPVLADVAFAKELTLSVASRYSDYDTFGDTTNNKFGFKWRPMDDLLVRGTVSDGFRAPTIGDLYGGGSQTFAFYSDPCDTVFGNAAGSARCLQDVPVGFRQQKQGGGPITAVGQQSPVPFNSGSNPYLEPETSKSKTVGFVYSPSYVQGLTVGLDWWNIRIENTMVSDSPSTMLSDCYVALIESRCAGFSRDPAQGFIVSDLTYGDRNAGYLETEGFDLDVGYKMDTDYGRFGLNWDTTYVSKSVIKQTNDVGTPESVRNGFGGNFRIRSNANLNWIMGDFSANWGVRYYSGRKEECSFDERCTYPNYAAPDTQGTIVPMNQLGANTFHDVQLSWSAPWNAKVSVGANNVFGHYGAAEYDQPNSNYSYYGGFDIGRFVYMKYQQNF